VSESSPGTGRRVVVGRRRGPAVTLLLSLLVTGFDALLLAAALGSFSALFNHPRALVLLAVWAVTGAILGLLRPVRSQDTIEIVREPRLVLVALGVIPLLTPPIAALGERLGLWPLPGGSALGWGGVALVAMGLALRIAAMTQLGPRFSPLLAVQNQHALETTGLYRWIRHPGYLGAWLAALGAALAFGSGLGLLPVALFGIVLGRRARREEALMQTHFNDAWLAYRARTGAFLPRLRSVR